ncbi:MAG: O-antigen ligase family protein, partial [Candidatus Methanofishera endochildressiae]|nr:O-antigen ligase family protein [Candidatus Methanofishera endochildressiae]
MNKVTCSYTSLIEPIIVNTSSNHGHAISGRRTFVTQWISITLLWALVLWRLRQPELYYPLFKDKAVLFYTLFIAWTVLAGVCWSVAKALSIFNSGTFLGGLLTYFIGYTASDKTSRYSYKALLGLGFLLVLYTFYQGFILNTGRPSGMLGNWNTHAALLAMILLPGIITYTLQSSASKLQLGFWSIMCLLFAFAMGLTLSRGAILIFATAVACIIILGWRQKLSIKYGLIFLSAFNDGDTCLMVYSSVTLSCNAWAATEASSLVALGSGRHLLWLPAWEMYLDRPYLGWGLGTFHLLHAQYKPPLSTEAGFFAHNDYLQILLELGPLGLIIFLCFIFIICRRLVNLTLKYTPDFSAYKIEAFALLATCVGILVHTFFTFHLYQLTIQIIWGYYLGRAARNITVSADAAVEPVPQKLAGKAIWFYRGFCTVVIILVVTFGLSFYFTYKAANTKDQQQALEYHRISGIFFPMVERYEVFSAQDLYLELQQLNPDKDKLERQKIANLALNRIAVAIQKMPANAEVYHTKAEMGKS